MITRDEFVSLLRDELGLPVTGDDLGVDFDQLPGWDSVHLLALVTMVERSSGHPLSVPDVLRAASLGEIYQLATT